MSINKEFDRSIAFTFYKEWKEDADMIEEDYGYEGKAKFYDAIIDYALYEIEPEMRPPVKYFWNTIKEKIDASQEHRSRGFSKADTETADKIISYKNDHPEASQREIADAVGCSLGKVNKTLKSEVSTNNINTSITNTIATTSTTVNMNVNTDEIKVFIMESFKKKHKWKQIQSDIKDQFGQDITYDFIKETIDAYTDNNNILESLKYNIKKEKDKLKAAEDFKNDCEKAKTEINIVIDACEGKFGFRPTVEEVMDTYIKDNTPSEYSGKKYYAFTMREMGRFINDIRYGDPKCWLDICRCWSEYCNTLYSLG